MSRTQTLRQLLAEQGITIDPRPEPPAPPIGDLLAIGGHAGGSDGS